MARRRKPASARAAAEAAKAAAAKAGEDAVDPAVSALPPSIQSSALRAELRRKPIAGDERASLKAERARLEELAAEIGRAREQLRQDTARLEAMLLARRTAGPGPSGGEMSGELSGGSPAPASPRGDLSKGDPNAVSKAMKGMKPEQAAAILSRLDRGLGAEINRRMPPADAGAVLGQLKPEIAADLATEIATRPPRGDAAKPEGR